MKEEIDAVNKLPRTKSPRFYSQVYKSAENHTIRVLSKASEVCNRFFCIHPHFKKVGFSASDYKSLLNGWLGPGKIYDY